MKRIGIIGGGLSGSLTVLHLLKTLSEKSVIYLFEKEYKRQFKGVAYSGDIEYQYLNVPARKMYLTPDHSFQEWIEQEGLEYHGIEGGFYPRDLFGRFVEETLKKVVAHQNRHTVKIVPAAVADLRPGTDGYEIYSDEGQRYTMHRVVLAVGNFPPANLGVIPPEVAVHPNYFRNPYDKQSLENLDPDETVFFIGTGLTMVDLVLSLKQKGHRGDIIALSRHGLLPLSHGASGSYDWVQAPAGNTPLDWFRWIRNEIQHAENNGKNWRHVVDSLRPITPKIWKGFSEEGRDQFLRHLKHHWEVSRHRIPRQSHDEIKEMRDRDQLQLCAARINNVQAKEGEFTVTFRPRGTSARQQRTVQRIINCTGANSNIDKVNSPLIKALQDQNLV